MSSNQFFDFSSLKQVRHNPYLRVAALKEQKISNRMKKKSKWTRTSREICYFFHVFLVHTVISSQNQPFANDSSTAEAEKQQLVKNIQEVIVKQ